VTNSRFYSNVAQQTTLSGSVTSGTTTLNVAATTGFPPSFPYTLAVDYGAATEELVSVTGAAGTTLTVTRGYGGTSTQSHSLGAVVRHVYDATDATDFRTHEADTAGVHGVTGDVVGTSDAQTLLNKTISGAVLSGTFTGTPTVSGAVVFSGNPSFTGTPTFSGDPDFSGQPTISDFTNATHDHSSAAEGGSPLQSVLVTSTSTSLVPLTIETVADTSVDAVTIKDPSGNRMLAFSHGGVFELKPTDTAATDLFSLNAPAGAFSGANLIDLLNDGALGFKVSLSGDTTAAGDASFANFQVVQNWTAPTLASGYSTNTGNGTPSYRVIKLLGDTYVQWRGTLNITYSGSAPVNSGKFLASALPAAATPATYRAVAAGCSSSSSSALTLRLDANVDGTMFLQTETGINPPWVSLNGVMYSL
jgi:hypothetical protein